MKPEDDIYALLVDEDYGHEVARAAADGVALALGRPRKAVFPAIYDGDGGKLEFLVESLECSSRLCRGNSFYYPGNVASVMIGNVPVREREVVPEISEDVVTRRLTQLLNANERLRPAVAAMRRTGHNAAEIIETLFPGN